MPTKNPRLTITLSPTLAAQLRKLSELTGNSQAGFISELLQGSSPVFDRLIVVLAAAKDAKNSMSGQIASDLRQAQQTLESQLGLALGDVFDISQPVLNDFETVRRRAPKASRVGAPLAGDTSAALAKSTPLSNRGVRSTTNTHRTAS